MQKVLIESGEICIHASSEAYILRPSLFAMTQIGSPAEIVTTYASVMADAPKDSQYQLMDALAVLYACSDHDISGLVGHFDTESLYVPGLVPEAHILPLARCLLKHGVVGALPPLPRKTDESSDYVTEFSARDHVALAMAHLGVSKDDAWALTMTDLVGALRAKFPQQESNEPGYRAPTKEQHEETMAWFDKIEAKRKASQGAH